MISSILQCSLWPSELRATMDDWFFFFWREGGSAETATPPRPLSWQQDTKVLLSPKTKLPENTASNEQVCSSHTIFSYVSKFTSCFGARMQTSFSRDTLKGSTFNMVRLEGPCYGYIGWTLGSHERATCKDKNMPHALRLININNYKRFGCASSCPLKGEMLSCYSSNKSFWCICIYNRKVQLAW